jgi:hypothetical protein
MDFERVEKELESILGYKLKLFSSGEALKLKFSGK